ncbi:MAG TPA: XTP/dITP diphosphatase [Candidatus Methanoperedenaceae archaeon]|nr:XTP/dITP diphosphatase [Candidatus Methanoperedenaceae archaeon]
MKKVIFVTSNAHKVKEAEHILGEEGIEVEQVNCGYPELQAEHIEEIARYGAEYAAKYLGSPVMVDDSGLFIDSLGGFPGPYSAYVYKRLGNSGILKLLRKQEERSAVFQCAIGYCEPFKEVRVFSGDVRGHIAKKARGKGGFGYDPIFEVNGKTFGEMDGAKKNEISHRARAMAKFAEWVGERG